MATLQQLREGIGNAWTSVVEGWRKLTDRATSAVTRFSPSAVDREENLDMLAELDTRNIGWGLLAAEVFADDRRVVVRVEAPGMKRSDFDIEIIGDLLVIRGQKKIERESSRGRYHVVECAYGSFERAIPLPAPVEDGRATAKYRKGILRIELPRRFDSGILRIPIR